jgi:hypothetical protein
MCSSAARTKLQYARRATVSLCALMLLAVPAPPAIAAACAFEPQGEGRVAAVIDARSFRLEDGREIRLAGIEPVGSENANRTAALSAIVTGQDVTLRGAATAASRPSYTFRPRTRWCRACCCRRAKRWRRPM